jgi:hypothetical protein
MYGSFVSHITNGGEPQSSILFPFVLGIFDWPAGSPRWLPMICIPPLLYHFLPRIMRGQGVVLFLHLHLLRFWDAWPEKFKSMRQACLKNFHIGTWKNI